MPLKESTVRIILERQGPIVKISGLPTKPQKPWYERPGLHFLVAPQIGLGKGLGLTLARLTPEVREIEKRISEGTASPGELEYYYQTFGKEAPTTGEVLGSALSTLLETVTLPKAIESGIETGRRLLGRKVTEEIPWQISPAKEYAVPRREGGKVTLPEIRWRWVPHPKYPGLEKLEIVGPEELETAPSIISRIGRGVAEWAKGYPVRLASGIGRRLEWWIPWMVSTYSIRRALREK